MDIWKEIKASYKEGSALTKLIYVNLGVFVVCKLIAVGFFLFSQSGVFNQYVMTLLAVPAYLPTLMVRPWTVFTYMFFHLDFLHILFNLLWLYWFGKVFLLYFNQKQLTSLYLIGGLSGAFLYILAYNTFPAFQSVLTYSQALGASAAVMAIAIGIAFYAPDYIFNLILIGPVKIKYIALFFILTDVIMIAGNNAGGHIAHLGGAMVGYYFAVAMRKGNDITKPLSRFLDLFVSLFTRRKKMTITYQKATQDYDFNYKKAQNQAEIDRILDKIAQNGYDSLSKIEKETLFKAGK
jgi:membrane associated rhomboid family serine protease